MAGDGKKNDVKHINPRGVAPPDGLDGCSEGKLRTPQEKQKHSRGKHKSSQVKVALHFAPDTRKHPMFYNREKNEQPPDKLYFVKRILFSHFFMSHPIQKNGSPMKSQLRA